MKVYYGSGLEHMRIMMHSFDKGATEPRKDTDKHGKSGDHREACPWGTEKHGKPRNNSVRVREIQWPDFVTLIGLRSYGKVVVRRNNQRHHRSGV